MNREHVITVLGLLKIAYPRFYADFSKDDAEKTIILWQSMFQNENPETVILAVKNLINTFKFPPSIADVKEQIYKMQNAEVDDTMELYALLKKAISNGIYGSVEEFAKLPPVVQKFVGSPSQLRSWAIDEDFNDGVLRGQFLRQIESLRQREKEDKMMLPEVKDKMSKLLEKSNAIKYLN